MSELNDKGIEELFSDRFKDFEVDVNPDLWSSVSQNIPAISASKGLSLLSKSLIGLSSVAVVTVASVIYFNSSDTKELVSLKDSIETKIQNSTEEETTQPEIEINNPRLIQETPTVETQLEKTTVTEVMVIENQEQIAEHVVANNMETETQVSSRIEEVAHVEKTTVKEETTQQQIQKEPEAVEIIENTPVKEVVKEEKVEFNLTIPNIFTPNNDGDNDVYFITSSGLKNFSFTVMNEQQKVIFQTEHTDFKWDGVQMNGQPAEAGNYFYILIAEDESGNMVKRANRITIRR